jgi:hypothetical protein
MIRVKKTKLLIIVRLRLLSTMSAISWRSVLLVEETGIPGENHRPSASQ